MSAKSSNSCAEQHLSPDQSLHLRSRRFPSSWCTSISRSPSTARPRTCAAFPRPWALRAAWSAWQHGMPTGWCAGVAVRPIGGLAGNTQNREPRTKPHRVHGPSRSVRDGEDPHRWPTPGRALLPPASGPESAAASPSPARGPLSWSRRPIQGAHHGKQPPRTRAGTP